MTEAEKIVRVQQLEIAVADKEKIVAETEAQIVDLKKQLKEQKEEARSAERHLRSFIRGEDEGLFKGVGDASEPVKVKRDYRTVTLKDLGIDGGKAGQSLKSANLHTLADIAAYTKKGLKLTDLDSIGEGKADKIIAACEKWFAENPPENDDEKAARTSFSTKAEPAVEEKTEEGEGKPQDEAPKQQAKSDPPVETKAERVRNSIAVSTFDEPAVILETLVSAHNECKSFFSQVMAQKNPKVYVFDLQDTTKNRFPRGKYVISEKKSNPEGDRYCMQRVYDQRDWMKRLGEYEQLKESSGYEPGPISGGEVTDLETGTVLYVSGDDEAFDIVNDLAAVEK